MFILAVSAASVAWFLTAAVLFFNPPVDRIYRSEEEHPAVRQLPQAPKTIGKILIAVVIQSLLWAYVYTLVRPALPDDPLTSGVFFGLVLVLTKIIPRDIDRILLTTYPPKRMAVEFIAGIVCSFIVGMMFSYLL